MLYIQPDSFLQLTSKKLAKLSKATTQETEQVNIVSYIHKPTERKTMQIAQKQHNSALNICNLPSIVVILVYV